MRARMSTVNKVSSFQIIEHRNLRKKLKRNMQKERKHLLEEIKEPHLSQAKRILLHSLPQLRQSEKKILTAYDCGEERREVSLYSARPPRAKKKKRVEACKGGMGREPCAYSSNSTKKRGTGSGYMLLWSSNGAMHKLLSKKTIHGCNNGIKMEIAAEKPNFQRTLSRKIGKKIGDLKKREVIVK